MQGAARLVNSRCVMLERKLLDKKGGGDLVYVRSKGTIGRAAVDLR